MSTAAVSRRAAPPEKKSEKKKSSPKPVATVPAKRASTSGAARSKPADADPATPGVLTRFEPEYDRDGELKPQPPDPFPLALENECLKEPSYKCRSARCRDDEGSEDPSKCGKCGQFREPADRPTIEWERFSNIQQLIEDHLPDLAACLMAAISCKCDCRRRRVMLRAARIALAEVVERMSEAEIGPGAVDGQYLTQREVDTYMQSHWTRNYAEHLLKEVRRWDEVCEKGARERGEEIDEDAGDHHLVKGNGGDGRKLIESDHWIDPKYRARAKDRADGGVDEDEADAARAHDGEHEPERGDATCSSTTLLAIPEGFDADDFDQVREVVSTSITEAFPFLDPKFVRDAARRYTSNPRMFPPGEPATDQEVLDALAQVGGAAFQEFPEQAALLSQAVHELLARRNREELPPADDPDSGSGLRRMVLAIVTEAFRRHHEMEGPR